jgi:hypothetical protein
MAVFIRRESSFPVRFAKIVFDCVFLRDCFRLSGVFEKQGATVAKRDFVSLPCRALVEPVRAGPGFDGSGELPCGQG